MIPSRGLVYILRCMPARYPERIVCLTEETTETLYLLGEERRIVGISGYTVRPPRARREKPRVSAFLSAKTDKILELKPDLVLGFSDLQAAISKDRVREAPKPFNGGPRFYLEEGDEPMISGIRWVSELVEIAGGEDVFKHLSFSQGAVGRTIADPNEVLKRDPEVILGSWCGKKFRPE